MRHRTTALAVSLIAALGLVGCSAAAPAPVETVTQTTASPAPPAPLEPEVSTPTPTPTPVSTPAPTPVSVPPPTPTAPVVDPAFESITDEQAMWLSAHHHVGNEKAATMRRLTCTANGVEGLRQDYADNLAAEGVVTAEQAIAWLAVYCA